MGKNYARVGVGMLVAGVVAATWVNFDLQAPSRELRGFHGIRFNVWNQMRDPNPSDKASSDFRIAHAVAGYRELLLDAGAGDEARLARFASMLELELASLPVMDAWTAIQKLRDQLRTEGPVAFRRAVLQYLTIVSDEILVAHPEKFSSRVTWKSDAQPPVCIAGSGANFRRIGAEACTGDIVITKGEVLSSSLVLFRSPWAVAYSHSSLAWIPSESGSSLKTLEANGLEGGVDDPDEGAPEPRLAVYRRNDGSPGQAQALEGAIASKVPWLGKSPFNFELAPDCAGHRYFCTELARCSYLDAGLPEQDNPYPRELWTDTTADVQRFVARFWTAQWGAVPTAGDVELNPRYSIVGMAVETAKVPRLRMRWVLVSAFIDSMERSSVLRWAFGRALRNAIEAKAKEGGGWRQLRSRVRGNVTELELALYDYLESRLLPALDARLQSQFDPAGKQAGLNVLAEAARDAVREELLREALPFGIAR